MITINNQIIFKYRWWGRRWRRWRRNWQVDWGGPSARRFPGRRVDRGNSNRILPSWAQWPLLIATLNWINFNWINSKSSYVSVVLKTAHIIRQNCSKTPLKWFENCSQTAPELLWNRSENALKMHGSCFEITIQLLINCSQTALKLL